MAKRRGRGEGTIVQRADGRWMARSISAGRTGGASESGVRATRRAVAEQVDDGCSVPCSRAPRCRTNA